MKVCVGVALLMILAAPATANPRDMISARLASTTAQPLVYARPAANTGSANGDAENAIAMSSYVMRAPGHPGAVSARPTAQSISMAEAITADAPAQMPDMALLGRSHVAAAEMLESGPMLATMTIVGADGMLYFAAKDQGLDPQLPGFDDGLGADPLAPAADRAMPAGALGDIGIDCSIRCITGTDQGALAAVISAAGNSAWRLDTLGSELFNDTRQVYMASTLAAEGIKQAWQGASQ